MSDIIVNDDLTERFKSWVDAEDGNCLEAGDSLTVILYDKRELVFRLEDVYTHKEEVNPA